MVILFDGECSMCSGFINFIDKFYKTEKECLVTNNPNEFYQYFLRDLFLLQYYLESF